MESADTDMVGIEAGKSRWSVKTVSDSSNGKVAINIVPTTVAALIAQAPPPDHWEPDTRFAPVETTIWQIDATLTAFKHELDGDYHIVLTDTSGNTMIAEIPDPTLLTDACIFKGMIATARNAFTSHFHLQLQALANMMTLSQPGIAVPMLQSLVIPVRISGVGFFDHLHGATGQAKNGIELHPVLSILFGQP